MKLKASANNYKRNLEKLDLSIMKLVVVYYIRKKGIIFLCKKNDFIIGFD